MEAVRYCGPGNHLHFKYSGYKTKNEHGVVVLVAECADCGAMVKMVDSVSAWIAKNYGRSRKTMKQPI